MALATARRRSVALLGVLLIALLLVAVQRAREDRDVRRWDDRPGQGRGASVTQSL